MLKYVSVQQRKHALMLLMNTNVTQQQGKIWKATYQSLSKKGQLSKKEKERQRGGIKKKIIEEQTPKVRCRAGLKRFKRYSLHER